MRFSILGDVMLDIQHLATTSRYAPEDPTIPVYQILSTENRLGGAANVAVNLESLGCTVEIFSVRGADVYGEKIVEMLAKNRIECRLWVQDGRHTTVKTRLYDHDNNHRLLHRNDTETRVNIPSSMEDEILEQLKEKITSWDAIVISDYNKGFITDRLCRHVIDIANQHQLPIFIDPKSGFSKYKGCFCIKPNRAEAQEMTGKTDIGDMMRIFREEGQCRNVVITCGKDGMYVNDERTHVRGKPALDFVDATGSGDIVLSMIVYGFLLHKDMFRAGQMANHVAARGVAHIGNYVPTVADLDDFLEPVLRCRDSSDCERLALIRATTRGRSSIVFTNGCFDVIHSAHISLLQFARGHGEILVVAINSDESVARLKPNRPINQLEERCRLIQSLNIVDYIVIFDQDTPIDILKHLRPDVIIKGGDYTEDQIIGREYCERVVLFDYRPGISSTLTIQKIKSTLNK